MTSATASVDGAEILAPTPVIFRKTKWSVIWLLTLTIFSALTVGGLLAPIQEAAKLDLGLSGLAPRLSSTTSSPST